MHTRIVWRSALLAAFTLAGVVTLSWTLGQPPAGAPVAPTVERPPPSVLPASLTGAPLPPIPGALPAATPAVAIAPDGPLAGLDRLPPVARQCTLAATRGAEWLCRMNLPSGRFRPGWVPALNVPLEQDHFLTQAQAAWALARAARFTGDEQHAVRAGQAVLSLLAETAVEGSGPAAIRRTSQPSLAANRLGAAALIVLAVHELPALEPEKDRENRQLLDQADQLCKFLVGRQRTDGSFATNDDPAIPDAEESVAQYPGLAVYALALSGRSRPAAWKTDAVKKSLAYCKQWWKDHPSVEFACVTAAAFAEAYLAGKDPAYAEYVLACCDWLCARQYEQLDPRHPRWYGGFPGTGPGRLAPTADSARCAWALAEACRVTRQIPDPARFDRYKSAATRGLQFLTTLQFTEDNAQHFTRDGRTFLVGGFHTSHQDGNLRAESTAWAVTALVPYLTHVAPAVRE